MSSNPYHRRGFGLKSAVEGSLRRDYHSMIVDRLKEQGNRLRTPRVEVRLAQEFGFCYGVERAVEYAYETVEKFPERRIYMIGEIIHNPHVNNRLREMGVRVLSFEEAAAGTERRFSPEDVVIIPAFGVPAPLFQSLRATDCILVDTTCGSVLNVWKNVEKYAREGFTSVIHGKYHHEETLATASRTSRHPGGQYLVVRTMEEALAVCAYIRERGDRSAFLERFRDATSSGFDPDRHLERIGLANQTTMLSSESLAIAEELRRAMVDRHGEEVAERFRSFDTTCSATQDRQDAVLELTREPLDLMLVIGGYNSSNTNHLATLTSRSVPTFHIESADRMIDARRIRHKPVGSSDEVLSEGWLPEPPVVVGVTAGASTPHNKIGEVIEQLLACCGVPLDDCGLSRTPAGR